MSETGLQEANLVAQASAATAASEERSRIRWLLVAATLMVVVLMSAAALVRPLDRDEGAFLTIAQEILHGRVPYRDVFDHKPPGVYYLLASVLALTAHGTVTAQLFAARGLALVADALTALGLFTLGKRWWRSSVGVAAALLWLLAAPFYGGSQVFTEPFAVAPTIWAFVVMTRRQTVRAAFSAGLLLALGALFKQTAILALPGLLILLYAGGASNRLTSRRLLLSLALLAGVAAPWCLALVVSAAQGALPDFLQDVIVINLVAYPPDSPASVQTGILTALIAFLALWIAAASVAGPVLVQALLPRRFGTSRWGAPAAAVAVTALLNIAPCFAHSYLHYWLEALPWASLLAALRLGELAVAWRRGGGARHRSVIARRAIGTSLLATGTVVTLVFQGLVTLTAPAAFHQLERQIALGREIAAHTPQGARLLIGPAEPEYYFLADRMPSTTYIYLLPINGDMALAAADDIHAERFDTIVWFFKSDVASDARIVDTQSGALALHYQATATDPTLHIVIYARGDAARKSPTVRVASSVFSSRLVGGWSGWENDLENLPIQPTATIWLDVRYFEHSSRT